jgi:uncharacterized protein
MKNRNVPLLETTPLTLLLSFFAILIAPAGETRQPIPFKVPDRLADKARPLSLSDIRLDGWLGERVLANEQNRLLKVDLEPLLAGYRKKPGTHPWIGEHIGKWMHAATLAWAYSGDEALRKKLDHAATELSRAQESDGYLGTYTPDKRFGLFEGADWDVWSHKYCLLGLLTYYQYTGDKQALLTAARAGDLLVATFGPGKKSILTAGTHMGMAATSVLEPMVLLYRFTGDERYLQFDRYIVQSWDEPHGPKIIDALLTVKQVNKTANGKAYEMLSNLVGLCELARATGDRSLLTPVLNAWQDIVEKRLYITGSASQGEHFHEDFQLPNEPKAAVSETCVTTTWIQLNAQLFRLTGEARFGDELERTFYNHLAAAQHPRGDDWCYFTPLEGTKRYQSDINCCHSSGPRGIALVPQQAGFILPGSGDLADTIAIDLYETSRITARLSSGAVILEQQTQFPRGNKVTVTIHVKRPLRFGLVFRTRAWMLPMQVAFRTAGSNELPRQEDGWLVIPRRTWIDNDQVTLTLNLRVEDIPGEHSNDGRVALRYGPLVLAYDQKLSPDAESPAEILLPEAAAAVPVQLKPGPGPLQFEGMVRSKRKPELHPAIFVPFADAGAGGEAFQIWLTQGKKNE